MEDKKNKPNKSISNPLRQIIIETDGSNINLIKAEVAGNLELIAILQNILQHISNPNKKEQLTK